MSSRYLTSSNMNLLQRLLGEVPERTTDATREIAAARMLVGAVEDGTDDEDDLRSRLTAYRMSFAAADAIARWDNEGGAGHAGRNAY